MVISTKPWMNQKETFNLQSQMNTDAVLAETPREAVANADVIFSSLLDDKACLETTRGEYLSD